MSFREKKKKEHRGMDLNVLEKSIAAMVQEVKGAVWGGEWRRQLR